MTGNLNEKRAPGAICPSSTDARNAGSNFYSPREPNSGTGGTALVSPLSHLSGSIQAPGPVGKTKTIPLQVKRLFPLVCAFIDHSGVNEKVPVSLLVSL